METGSSPTDGRDVDGGPEEALFFLFALFLDLVSRGAIGDPITVTAAPARTSSSRDNNVSPSELKSSRRRLDPRCDAGGTRIATLSTSLRNTLRWHLKLIRDSRLGDSHGQHSDISCTRAKLSGH